MSGISHDTLLFASISAILIGTCYYKPDLQTLFQWSMKGILSLALLAVLAHLIESWRRRLQCYRGSTSESTIDEERVKEQEQVERSRLQKEHEKKADDYTERILIPRRNAKREEKELKASQFSGPVWKGAAHALGGADHREVRGSRDGSSKEAASLRQLPEGTIKPQPPPRPQKTTTQPQKTTTEKVIVLPKEPEEGATDAVSVVLRTCQGRRHKRRFSTSDTVQVLLDYMTSFGYHEKVYTLVMSYPRRDLSADSAHTLQELGLTSSLVLNVEQRDKPLSQN